MKIQGAHKVVVRLSRSDPTSHSASGAVWLQHATHIKVVFRVRQCVASHRLGESWHWFGIDLVVALPSSGGR
jgi:hypothetical protein